MHENLPKPYLCHYKLYVGESIRIVTFCIIFINFSLLVWQIINYLNFWSLQHSRLLKISLSIFRRMQAFSIVFKSIEVFSSQTKTIPGNSILFLPILVHSNPFQSIPDYKSLFQHILGYSDLFQRIPSYSSLFQTMSAYTSLFQPTQGYLIGWCEI